MCERWAGDWTNRNILTPSSFVFCSCSFSYCWAAQSGVLRAHSPLWVLVLSTASYLQVDCNLLNFLSHWVISLFDIHLLLVGVTSAPNSTRPQSRLYPDIFDRMHLLLTWVHFLFDSSAEGQYVTHGCTCSYPIYIYSIDGILTKCTSLRMRRDLRVMAMKGYSTL